MMERNEEAKILYGDSDFKILRAGSYVSCARTGQKIALSELRYWNVKTQEPYASPEIALKAELEARRITIKGEKPQ